MEKEKSNSGDILDYQILKRLIRFVIPYKKKFFTLVFLTICVGMLAPFKPILIQYTLDNHVAFGDINGLINTIILLIVLLFLQAIVQYYHTYLSGWLGQYIIKDIRIQLYKHILSLKVRFFDKTPIGRLVTRTVSDVETLADVFSQGLAAMTGDILQLLFILGIMIYMNWKLTLISLSMLPLLLLSTYIFKEKIKGVFNEVRNAVSNLNTFVQEHISGMYIVQIFGSEKREYEKFKKINQEHKSANINSVLYYSIYFPVAEIISAAGISLLVWYGTKGVIDFEKSGISLGTLIAFIMYIQMFFRPIRMIADRFNTLQLGIVSTSRIIKLLDDKSQILDNGLGSLNDIKTEIEFKNVWFGYNQNEYVLKNISFKVEEGQTVALVGSTGAGKSSIINILNRFYDVSRGEILIGKKDISSFKLEELRSTIGIVQQDVFLFSNTIKENITLGNQKISEKMIMDAAELVGAKQFIQDLPNGLYYNVMERGMMLSVGQRQLISFIRSMVYNPKILILDEATSSVDTNTEKMIQEAINKMMKNRTCIVIAHRLSTIQQASKIIVVDKGEIKEAGTHQQLLDLNRSYSQLHKMQFKNVGV